MTDVSPQTASTAANARRLVRSPVGMALIALAAVLLIIAIWALVSRASIASDYETRLQAQEARATRLAAELSSIQSRAGEAETLNKRIEAEKAELAKLEEARGQAERSAGEAQQSLQQVRDELQQFEATRKQVEAEELERLRQIEAAEECSKRIAGELEKLDQALTARRDELSDVGKRLVDARNQEATLRASLSELNERAAQMAREAAGAEARIQEARAIEAQAQEQLSFVRSKVAELENRLASLTREFSKRAEELTRSPQDGASPAQLPPPGARDAAPEPGPAPTPATEGAAPRAD